MGWDEEAGELITYFIGPCTCPPECPNFDDPDAHSWGDCGATLPNGTECPCEAGWEE